MSRHSIQRGPATLQQVADRAGVSLATASRTLNGQSGLVREGLRERVLAAAVELHYVPNAQAQALARASSSTVGLIVHDINDPYFSAVAQGAIDAATDAGLFVMICSDRRDPDRELQYMASLNAQRVRAVVLAGSGFEHAEARAGTRAQIEALQAAGVRVACITDHGVPIDTVLPDNRGGARDLGRMLLEQGHREFAVVSGPPELNTTRERLRGLRAALREGGVALSPGRVVDGGFTREGGRAAAAELLRRAPEATVLVCLTDMMAVGALAALRAAGRRVPDDVSVTGFDDIQLADDVHPGLTTVRVPMSRLGAEAIRLALDDTTREPRRVPVQTEVVLRGSTAPPDSTVVRPEL